MSKTYAKRKHSNVKSRRRKAGFLSSSMMNKYKMPSMSQLHDQSKKMIDKHYQEGFNSAQKQANNLVKSTSDIYNKQSKSAVDMYNKQSKSAVDMYNKQSKSAVDMYNKQKYSSPTNFIAAKTLETTASAAKTVGTGMTKQVSNKMQPHINASKQYMNSFTPNFTSKNTTLALERSRSGPTVSSAYNPTAADVPVP